jgi:ribosomal protein L11 methyltransferase
MAFYEMEFPLAALPAEAVEAALFELGASSVTFVDRGDDPVLEPKPGEMRLWPDTLVRALFAQQQEAVSRLAALGELLGPAVAAGARILPVVERDWTRVWMQDWKSQRFGARLWVCPTEAPMPAQTDAVVVRLDPGLAFGTGTHPTTALCLELLESLPLTGRSVIDYGCGSGILGIAALKLGAARVTAVDLDPQALLATRENARRNAVAHRIEIEDVSAALRPAWCVVANILAGPLIELAPLLTAACQAGGVLVLSGVLRTQTGELRAAYAPGFDNVSIVERDDWACLLARRTV